MINLNRKTESYLRLCRKFKDSRLPELKFINVEKHYNEIYKQSFEIDASDIHKATMGIFLMSFLFIGLISLFISLFVIYFNILIIFSYTILISFIISYFFNTFLIKKIKRTEQLLNSILYFIKSDFSLLQKTSRGFTDSCLKFIELMVNYDISISPDFKEILSNIQCGTQPEQALRNYISPSKDFNKYLQNLIIKDFNTRTFLEIRDWNINLINDSNALEEDFKIYLKDITNKLSLLFFIGIFIPIGLCFLFFFISENTYIMLLILPFFLILLNYLFKQFIKKNHFLIGMIKNNSKSEHKKLNEFLELIEKFAINLKRNISPEKAFLNAYLTEKNNLSTLFSLLEDEIIGFFNGVYTFIETLELFIIKLKSRRYSIIINSLIKMLRESSYYSSEELIEIITVFKKHQKLQNKLRVLIKGERFKTFIFLIILPIIIGSIGALVPFLPKVMENLLNFEELGSFGIGAAGTNLNTPQLDLIDIILLLFAFLISNSISSFYFLSIINYQNKSIIILISDIIFLITYSLSILNIITLVL
jgi:hypothetical protein